MTNDETKIRQLLSRFMAGETTVEEEELISEWFLTHPDASSDLEPYRKMFAWFGDGMPEDGLDSITPAADESAASDNQADDGSLGNAAIVPIRHHLWLRAASVAAVIALSATLLFLSKPWGGHHGMPETASTTTLPADSLRETKAVSDSIPTQPSESQATEQLPKADNPKQTKRTRPVRRGYYRHKFSPAPPATLLAVNDSTAAEGERMVDETLAKMEAEEKQIFRQVDINTAMSDYILTAILIDEADADATVVNEANDDELY